MVEIIIERNGLVRRLSGTVTMTELDASAQEIQGNARIDEMRYNIHDFTAVTDLDVAEGEIEFMAARAAFSVQRNPHIKLAFVGHHPVMHRMMDAFNEFSISHHRVVRFDTLDEARRYTGSESGSR